MKDLKEFANYMKTCKNIIVMSGAGISTNAGIPDFRSPASGLYDKLSHIQQQLPFPEAIFTLEYFKLNPKALYTLAHELYPLIENSKPTISHLFIKKLSDNGMLLRHYTQNVDGLDTQLLPTHKLVQAHGHFRTGHCLKCKAIYSFDYMKTYVQENGVPLCVKCKHEPIKPDIILFGEQLPHELFEQSNRDFYTCDCLIVCGTSLSVQPFASLLDKCDVKVPKLLINRECVQNSHLFDLFYKSDCDEAFKELTSLLNF